MQVSCGSLAHGRATGEIWNFIQASSDVPSLGGTCKLGPQGALRHCTLRSEASSSSPAPASIPHGPGEGAAGFGESDGAGTLAALESWGCALQIGGLCGVPGWGTQESGEGPVAAWDGESKPESSTFSGEEEENGEGLEVKPRLLEPRGLEGRSTQPCPSDRPHPQSLPCHIHLH